MGHDGNYSKQVKMVEGEPQVCFFFFFEKFELFSSFTKRTGFKIDQCMN